MHEKRRAARPYPVLMVNSMVSFLLAWMAITALHLGVTAITANAYHIPIALDLNGFSFPISNYSSLWTADAIRMIFVAGPAVCLLAGFAFAGWSLSLGARDVFLRDFFFWLAFHGINMALGGVIAGVLTSSGFAWFAKWIYLNETARFFIALLAFFGLALSGILLTPLSLRSAPSLWHIRWHDRYIYLFSRMLVPWMAGLAIIVLLRLPAIPLHDLILLGTPAVIIAACYAHTGSVREQDLEAAFLSERGVDEAKDPRESLYDPPEHPAIRWGAFILLLLLLAGYRILLTSKVILG